MKQAEILKVLALDLGTAVLSEVNALLKNKEARATKYRMTGESLGHYGFTGAIKTVTTEGLKVFDVNKVTLIRFTEIETFEKAKPRSERPQRPKADPKATAKAETEVAKPAKKTSKKLKVTDDDGYGEAIRAPRIRGSRFIPTSRK